MSVLPTETFVIIILALMLMIFIGAVAMAALAKWKSGDGAKAEQASMEKEILAAMKQTDHPLPAPVPEPPTDPLERHAHLIALENRARDAALRIAGETADAADILVLAGPGPLGAVALAAIRRLDSLGLRATAQLMHHEKKLGEEGQRELHTLKAARLSVIESPTPRPLDGVTRVLVGVTPETLPETRQQDLEAILRNADAAGIPVDVLDAFDARYRPPAPRMEDPVIPVPSQALSREDSRLLDSLAQEHYGILGAALMENAGFWGAREAYLVASDLAEQKGADVPVVTVLCGRGNNGGDGFVIARHLHHWGATPRVFLLGMKDRVTDDNGSNMKLLEAEGVKVTPIFDESQWPMVSESLDGSHLIVDAVLGTGMTGTVRGAAVEAIRFMNAAREKGARTAGLMAALVAVAGLVGLFIRLRPARQ